MRCIVSALVGALFLVVESAFAIPLNGDFSSGLDHWVSSGGVSVASAEAILLDTEPSASLFQGAALGVGQYVITFDFMGNLSEYLPPQEPFAFPDVFFASLYFTDDMSSFTPATAGDSIGLFDLEYTGISDLNGEVGPSVKGTGWLKYRGLFSNNYAFVVPYFELLDLNWEAGDSSVRLDNVVLSRYQAEIPEGATILLLASGLFGALARKVHTKKV